MKLVVTALVGWLLLAAPSTAKAQRPQPQPQPRVLELNAIINQIRMPGGVAQVTQQLVEVRRKYPEAQLFPEVTVSLHRHRPYARWRAEVSGGGVQA